MKIKYLTLIVHIENPILQMVVIKLKTNEKKCTYCELMNYRSVEVSNYNRYKNSIDIFRRSTSSVLERVVG